MEKGKKRVISVCAAIAIIASALAGCADMSLAGRNDSLKPGNASQSGEQTTADTTVPVNGTESSTPEETTQGTVRFVTDSDGKIVGKLSDYDINFDINGVKFNTAEFENNAETYVDELYDLLADDAPYKEDRISPYYGKHQTYLKYSMDIGLAGMVAFIASAGGCISYGTQGGHPLTDTSVVDFKMNGIKIGDNIEKALECYGEPTDKHDSNCPTHWNGPDEEPTDGCQGHSYWYRFEDNSFILIHWMSEGEIVSIMLMYPAPDEETAVQEG